MPLQSAQSVPLQRVATGLEHPIACVDVVQRNWSRVAVGRASAECDQRQLFLKQFIDSRGVAHLDQYHDEFSAIRKAKDLFSDRANIPDPAYRNAERLIIGFDHYEMTTIDVVLRSGCDAAQMQQAFDYTLKAADAFLESLRASDDGTGAVPVFRGFDIRNIGIPCENGELLWHQPPYLFDFGVYRAGSYQEAAARILTSIGMLNWGKPMQRFVQGPDAAWFRQAAAALAPYISRQRLLQRIGHEYAHRVKDVQATSWVDRQLKRLGLFTVGYVYIQKMRQLVRALPMAE